MGKTAWGGTRGLRAIPSPDGTPQGIKTRKVYLTNGAKRAMDDRLKVRGIEPGPLLVPVDQFGVVTIRRLCDQTMYEICKRLYRRAGIAVLSGQREV